MIVKQSLRQQRQGDDEANPKFGFGTSSSAARAESPYNMKFGLGTSSSTTRATSPYSMNPSSTGEDSAAQGSRQVDQDNSSGLDWMRATTDEISRSTQQSINTYNSPQFQRMLDNQTARSRSANNWQDQRARGNAIFSNQMQRQNQAIAVAQQSQMTRQQMGWAQDLALGGQPGDGRRQGGSTVSIEYSYSPFQTFMGNAAIIGNLGNFYNTQANERMQERQLALQERGMNMDDRYRTRALAMDAIIRANQRSFWSSPLEQIALNQARQPGMVR